jgi:hypothetical protein
MSAKILAGVGYLLKLEFMAGARTYVAAVGLACLAVSQFVDGNYDGAVAAFSGAMALVGLRAKVADRPAQ